MPRLLVFIGFCGVLAFFFSLKSFKKIPVTNEKIDVAAMELALKEKNSGHEKKEEKKVISKTITVGGQEVVLKSQEAINGHAIYFEKGQCFTCHGDRAQGLPEKNAPYLAFQYDWYIETQLKNFKSGERSNPDMIPYIKDLTEEDFKNVAAFLSQLPKTTN